MALFDQWPYTNIHNLNTDWLVKTVKEVKDKTDEIDQAVSDAGDYAQDAKNAKIAAQKAQHDAEDALQTMQDFSEELNEQVQTNTQNIAVQTARIDTIISGVTPDADAELLDIRVGYDSTTYPTAGDAVRGQVSDIHSLLNNVIEAGNNLFSINDQTVNGVTITSYNSNVILDGSATGGTEKVLIGTLPAGTYTAKMTVNSGTTDIPSSPSIHYGLASDGSDSVRWVNINHLQETITLAVTNYIFLSWDNNVTFANYNLDFVINTGSVIINTPYSFSAIDYVARNKTSVKYVATTGNDGDDGSQSYPYATVAKALAEGADTIVLADGTYYEELYLTYKTVNIIARNAVFEYDTSISNTYAPWDFRYCNAVIKGIAIVMTNFTGSISGFNMHNCRVEFENCSVNGAPYMGFRLNGSYSVCKDCVATNNGIDGFNAHDTTEYHSEGTFVNCKAISNGDDGLSYHENGKINVTGGIYADNVSAGIAPHDNTYAYITNAMMMNNNIGVDALYPSYVSGPKPECYLISNIIGYNTTYGVNASYYNVLAFNNGMTNNDEDYHAGTGATITQL